MNIRPATIVDAKTLFEWRNDPITRKMFKTTELVDWNEHIKWLNNRLSQSNPYLYVAEIEGVPVGTLRNDEGKLSYTVAPEFRGRGYATEMLRWAKDKFGPLEAEIKPENIPSIHAANAAGHIVVLL